MRAEPLGNDYKEKTSETFNSPNTIKKLLWKDCNDLQQFCGVGCRGF